MRAWRTLTDPPQLWHFPFCCRQSLAADPASPPGDVPSLNVWLREIRCDGSQGWQVAEVSQSVRAACDGKGDERSFLHFLPAGVFSFVSGSIKNPQKREKRHQAPLKTDFITAIACSVCQLPSAWCSSSKSLFPCLGQLWMQISAWIQLVARSLCPRWVT